MSSQDHGGRGTAAAENAGVGKAAGITDDEIARTSERELERPGHHAGPAARVDDEQRGRALRPVLPGIAGADDS